MRLFFLMFGLLAGVSAVGEVLVKDDFVNAGFDARRAMRGDWRFLDGVASCTQDDELYKKYKDHGPILFYDLAVEDVAVSFAFQADAAVKTVVFTANGADGHVFRFVISPAGLNVRAFPVDDPKVKSVPLAVSKDLALKPGEWTSVAVRLSGDKAWIKVGEVEVPVVHESFARGKVNLSLGFSFGTLAVREWLVTRG